jgi:hypothetical protein
MPTEEPIEQRTILETIADVANPEITTIIEFEPNSVLTLGGVLLAVIVIAVIAWALARKMSNP